MLAGESPVPKMTRKKITQAFGRDAHCQKLSNLIYHHDQMSKQLPQNLGHGPCHIVLVLLIAKLNAYGSSFPDLRLIHDFFLNKKPRSKINNSYSTWLDLVFWSTGRINTWPPFVQHFSCRFVLHCK